MKEKLYTITNTNQNNMVYVGLTTQTLEKRWYKHKYQAKKDLWKLPFHNYIENEDEWKISLFEEIEADTQEELFLKEAELITKIGTLNVNIFSFENNKKQYLKNPNFIGETKKMI